MATLPASATAPAELSAEAKRLGLTPREVEALQLIAQDRTNGEIASDLSVSEATVKTHINHIFAKIGARDRAQAIVLARRLGLA